MKIIRGFENLSLLSFPTAIAIGNFDGLHLGHKKILGFLVEIAKRKGLFSLVLTFSPHPEKILGKRKICMIQTLEQRLEGIKKTGVQAVLVNPFDSVFSNLSASDFARKILAETLQAEDVIVGENFRFGKNREGNILLLQDLGRKLHFAVHSIPAQKEQGRIISSSLIRKLLQEGRIEEANVLLGRAYEIEGEVIRGEERGRTIGFPTANIQTKNEIMPPGVFITLVQVDSERFPSLTNVGKRPTFCQKCLHIESHLIDFDKNLYGNKIRISFLKKLRDEVVFKNPKELSSQIKKDLKAALAFFNLLLRLP